MSTTSKRSGARSSGIAKPDYGVFAPDMFWGRMLPRSTSPAGTENFEARVEHAWAYMKGAFFAVEEHERLYACINELLARWEDTG
jgi:hypothetical protein